MKIAFDHNVPAQLRPALGQHQIDLAIELGWDLLANGNLMREAQRVGYDVLVTCDSDFKVYEHRADRVIAILYLRTNHRYSILAYSEALRRIVDGLKPGDFAEVVVPRVKRPRVT